MTTDIHTASQDPGAARLDPAEVCTLPAGGLAERLAWVRAEILPHAVAREEIDDGIAWELHDAPGLAAKLDQLVALERECCSGVVFEHAPSGADRRRLQVRGIDPRTALFETLLGEAGPPARLGARLARAAGLGSGLSLLVCCVLPIGAASLLGAAAAAPFASLDQPWIIGGVALATGVAAFAWHGRRLRAAPANARSQEFCGPGC